MAFRTTALGAFIATLALPAAASTVYSGITFPDGDASFADELVGYVLGDGVAGTYDDPYDVLGAPDYNGSAETGSFSLGVPGLNPDNLADNLYGSVTVKFTDNSLTTSGDADADLFIFEIGGAVERYLVEISKNGTDWITAALVTGQPSQIDIDAVAGVTDGDQFSYVRVSDAPDGPYSGFPYAGPDIDAIGAISSAPPVAAVPLPASGVLLVAALGGLVLRRKRS